jgi:hypothetical protein
MKAATEILWIARVIELQIVDLCVDSKYCFTLQRTLQVKNHNYNP